jgi:hypothetical protein
MIYILLRVIDFTRTSFSNDGVVRPRILRYEYSVWPRLGAIFISTQTIHAAIDGRERIA